MGLRIRTNNKELFNKINALNFTDEVIINSVKSSSVSKILKSINRKDKKIEKVELNNRILLKRIKPINMNLYYTRR